jgi:hypothetical protein
VIINMSQHGRRAVGVNALEGEWSADSSAGSTSAREQCVAQTFVTQLQSEVGVFARRAVYEDVLADPNRHPSHAPLTRSLPGGSNPKTAESSPGSLVCDKAVDP